VLLYFLYRPYLSLLNGLVYFKYPQLLLVNIVSFFLDLFHVYSRNYSEVEASPSELTYGEMSYYSVWKCVKELKGQTFGECIDLGSGLGKSLIFLSLILECPCRGLEIDPIYVELSNRLLSFLNYKDSRIDLTNMTTLSSNEKALVFYPATCLEPSTMEAMNNRFKQLRSGSVVVSLSEKLNLSDYDIIKELSLPMSWGYTTVFIQQRR
jgi:hypothetical protein